MDAEYIKSLLNKRVTFTRKVSQSSKKTLEGIFIKSQYSGNHHILIGDGSDISYPKIYNDINYTVDINLGEMTSMDLKNAGVTSIRLINITYELW